MKLCGPDGSIGTTDDDCDDLDSSRAPGLAEVCDADDEDCDELIDEGFDADLDGVTSCGGDGIEGTADDDCDDGAAAVYPGAPELCDGLDDDCDGVLPADEGDIDGDGYRPCSGCVDGFCDDCDDLEEEVHPAVAELCNGVDDDCDGEPDDGLVFQRWWADGDGDGYGDADVPLPGGETCEDPGSGWATNDEDCNDDEGAAHPGGTEVSGNAVDEDCDGLAEGEPSSQTLIVAPGISCSAGGGFHGGAFGVLLLLAIRRRRQQGVSVDQ